MTTLTSAASRIIVDNHNNNNKDRCFLSSQGFHINKKPESLFSASKKHVNARFLQLKAASLQPISALSFDAQAEVETEAQTPATCESKTVHVKFQLQKECLFGEQFFLVGDDPMLGLWDPTSAIPLDWSDEHIWTIELDAPLGKTIQFKFILRESTGQIVWQPGPDRIFETWETKNTITVFEDWEDAEEQKIIEEDPTFTAKMLVAHDFTQPKEAPVSTTDHDPVAVDSNVNAAKVPKKPMSIGAEDISCPKEEDLMFTGINQVLREEHTSQPDAKSEDNKSAKIEQEVLGSSGRAAMIKDQTAENIVGCPGDDTVPKASDEMRGSAATIKSNN